VNRRTGIVFGRAFVIAALFVGGLISLVPFVWLVAAAFKTQGDMFIYQFFPPLDRLTTQSFHDLFYPPPGQGLSTPFYVFVMNSIFVTCTIVITQLFFASLAGYALAKYEFVGKKPIMLIMLCTVVLPSQVTLAPLYDLLFHLHMLDQFSGLIVPGAASVFGIFLFRQAILGVPNELLNAARIDGCSEFRIYWDIVMPVVRPMIGAFCLISFLGNWNNFIFPQILLHHENRFTLPVTLAQMIALESNKYGMLMGGTLLAILPVFVLFLALQKEFVAGLTSGAVKG
jgi:ABC-type glycerol-3-phosphate transport system permease component